MAAESDTVSYYMSHKKLQEYTPFIESNDKILVNKVVIVIRRQITTTVNFIAVLRFITRKPLILSQTVKKHQ